MNLDSHSSLKMQERPNSRILVVDDDFAARLQVKFALENSGFTVAEAANGEEALQAEYKPNLVLLDVVMPDMDGFSTCRGIRQLPDGAFIPVVMITALEDEETITKAFEAGATDYVSKPINLLVLGYRARYWLRTGALVSQLRRSQENLVKAQQIARMGHWEFNPANGVLHFSAPLT